MNEFRPNRAMRINPDVRILLDGDILIEVITSEMYDSKLLEINEDSYPSLVEMDMSYADKSDREVLLELLLWYFPVTVLALKGSVLQATVIRTQLPEKEPQSEFYTVVIEPLQGKIKEIMYEPESPIEILPYLSSPHCIILDAMGREVRWIIIYNKGGFDYSTYTIPYGVDKYDWK